MTEKQKSAVLDHPKYYQISKEIIESIKKGKIIKGAKVPSENEIIKNYEVSNTTARKALQEVENQGWVKKVKGKGTFVSEQTIERSANKILSFTDNMRQSGFVPSTKVLNTQVFHRDQSLSIQGRNYTMKGPIFKMHRLRYADAIPMMIEVRYISLKFCPNIDKKDMARSLYSIYEKDYNLELKDIKQVLSASMIGPGTMEFFDLKDPIPGLKVEGLSFCGVEMILEMESSLYRGDKYQFSVNAN
jgi:GntR family transcriptional regulator